MGGEGRPGSTSSRTCAPRTRFGQLPAGKLLRRGGRRKRRRQLPELVSELSLRGGRTVSEATTTRHRALLVVDDGGARLSRALDQPPPPCRSTTPPRSAPANALAGAHSSCGPKSRDQPPFDRVQHRDQRHARGEDCIRGAPSGQLYHVGGLSGAEPQTGRAQSRAPPASWGGRRRARIFDHRRLGRGQGGVGHLRPDRGRRLRGDPQRRPPRPADRDAGRAVLRGGAARRQRHAAAQPARRGASMAYAYGYWGAPREEDRDISYASGKLDFNAFSRARAGADELVRRGWTDVTARDRDQLRKPADWAPSRDGERKRRAASTARSSARSAARWRARSPTRR